MIIMPISENLGWIRSSPESDELWRVTAQEYLDMVKV